MIFNWNKWKTTLKMVLGLQRVLNAAARVFSSTNKYAASAHRAALAQCAWMSCVQAVHRDVRLHAWSRPTVPDRLLSSSFRSCTAATSSFHQSTTPGRATLLEQFIWSAGLLLAGPLAWNLLPDYMLEESVDSIWRRFCSHCTNAHSALEVLRLCAI